MLLSVCIITKNEESCIKSCLESVYKVADEIIIVDSCSTDKTLEISKKFTNKIFIREWQDDFSKARNFCISKANGKWILIIDADEVFKCDINFLFFLKKTKSNAFIIFRNEIFRRHIDSKLVSIPVGIIRLFRTDTQATFKYAIHERLDDFFIDNNIKVDILKNAFLNHNIFNLSKEKLDEKQIKYLAIINKELLNNPKNHWLLFQRAKTNLNLNIIKDSKKDLEFLTLENIIEEKIKIASFVLLSIIHNKENETKKSILLLEKVKKTYKHSIISLYLGDFYFEKKLHLKALSAYLSLKSNKHTLSYNSTMFLISYVPKEIKLFKILLVLYSLRFYKFILITCYLNKRNESSEILLIKSLIYLKSNNKNKAIFYLKRAKHLDNQWKRLNELEDQLY